MELTQAVAQEVRTISRTITNEGASLISQVLSVLTRKWAFCVLYTLALSGTPLRFTDIFSNTRGISYKVLCQILRDLEHNGLIKKDAHKHQVPPRTDYELTPLGQSLFQQIAPVWMWFVLSAHDFEDARKISEKLGNSTKNSNIHSIKNS
jgi:DNA-binding HxlR family transcriptional regulator